MEWGSRVGRSAQTRLPGLGRDCGSPPTAVSRELQMLAAQSVSVAQTLALVVPPPPSFRVKRASVIPHWRSPEPIDGPPE